MLRIIWEQLFLPKLLKRLRVDLVYTGNNVAIFRSPVPCVISVQNMEPLVPVRPGTPAVLALRLVMLRWLTFLSLRVACRIVAVSEYVKKELVSLNVAPTRIDVIGYGVDDVELSSDDAELGACGPYLAAAAKFVRYANLELLIRGYAHIRARGFTGPLVIAGGPHDVGYEKEILSLAHSLKLDDHIQFLGYIPRSRLQALMRGCAVFLFTSVLEACPFTLLEALYQGAPVVATTAPPMPEVCGEAAVLVPPTDWRAFGDAAFQIVSSPLLRSELREGSRRRGLSFRWATVVEALDKSFRIAVAESMSGRGAGCPDMHTKR